MNEATPSIKIPSIMTANCFFWSPATNAAGRRSNETRRNAEVENFLAAHADKISAAGIEVHFQYSESCKNVYKTCRITRNGKRSNIAALRKALGI